MYPTCVSSNHCAFSKSWLNKLWNEDALDNFLRHYLTNQSPHLLNNPLLQNTPLHLHFALHRCLVYDGEILNYHTLHCGPGVGGEFTPHIITSGNPHDPGFGPEAKSPRGEITHHLATLLSPFWYAVMPLPTRYGMIW